MGEISLPAAKSIDEWEDALATLRVTNHVPDYSKLVELCRRSPMLRFAFNRERHMETENITVFNVSNGVRFALGIAHWSERPPPADEIVEQFFLEMIEAAETNREIFDGLALVLGFAQRRRAQVPECANNWIANYLSQRLTIPKRRTGQHPFINRERDELLRHFLRDIQSLGVGITENEATYRESSTAHAIVEALGNNYTVPNAKTLMNIWSKRYRR